MFLSKFDREQQLAFLAIAKRIVSADGILDRREENAINAMRVEMGLFEESKLPTTPLEKTVSVFEDHKSRVFAFIEWLALAYVDENFSKNEKQLLRSIALLFDFTEEKANEIENWVISYRELIQKVDNL